MTMTVHIIKKCRPFRNNFKMLAGGSNASQDTNHTVSLHAHCAHRVWRGPSSSLCENLVWSSESTQPWREEDCSAALLLFGNCFCGLPFLKIACFIWRT